MNASCHCGAVSVQLDHAPEYVNFCDCSLCRKTGGVWGYFEQSEVHIKGQTLSYRRPDYDKPAVEVRRCPACGTVTHWVLTEHFDGTRMGVNMRLFAPPELAGIEARTLDGHNWVGDTEPVHRRPIGKLGEDVFI
ncbi:GFA family protein [Parerythrobacter aurantius]|uniref:GFA family protein n=1 Tax=Parerythrobacter aurantius TaxID=3127706 RepID=UPI003F4965FC